MVGEVFAQGCNQIFQIEGGPNVKVEEGVIEKLIWIDYKSIFFFLAWGGYWGYPYPCLHLRSLCSRVIQSQVDS